VLLGALLLSALLLVLVLLLPVAQLPPGCSLASARSSSASCPGPYRPCSERGGASRRRRGRGGGQGAAATVSKA